MVLIASAVLLSLTAALANPGSDLEALRVTGQAAPEEVARIVEEGVAAQRETAASRSPAQRCADAFVAAEWHRAAARLVPEAGYREEALNRFRAMRLDFPGQPTSWLGYIGEARVHRQAGQLNRALDVLAAVTDPGAPASEAIRRLAQLDRLEVELLRDPAEALAQAEAIGDTAAWIEARALAALGRAEDAAQAARRPAAVASAPGYDRLRLLAELGQATDTEWTAWAELLASLEMPGRALAALDARAPDTARGLHAQLLYDAGRRVDAADRWTQVLAAAPDDDVARWSAAVSLTQAAGENATLIPRAKEALLGVAGRRSVNPDQRRAALRWWAVWSTPAEVAARLGEDESLIIDDAELRYRLLAARMYEGPAPEDITEQLIAIEHDAADNDALRAAAILTRAQRGAAGPRAALAVLDEHRALLEAQSDTATAAAQLRIQLWVAAGLIEPALDAVLASPDGYAPDVLLELAEALVEREAGRPGGQVFTEAGRSRIVRLVNGALVQRPGDEVLTRRGAGLLMDAEAWSDAVRLLDGAHAPAARLLRARAMLQMDRAEEAWAALEALDTPEASVLRAVWLIAEEKFADAITEARAARSASPVGGDTWWWATCELIAAQTRLGQTAAAADVLRVAEVLHPVGERRDLRRRVESLRKEISP